MGKWNNDLAHNLAMMLVFHLAEILAILWYFNLSLNHDQQFAMDVILDQFLAFDLAILVFHLAEILQSCRILNCLKIMTNSTTWPMELLSSRRDFKSSLRCSCCS